MSGDYFSCLNWGRGATGIYRVETRDTATYPVMHRTTPPQRRVIWLKIPIEARFGSFGIGGT